MKTVLITGANSGIGFATVKLFLKNKYKVLAHYNSNKDNLEKIKDNNLFIYQADFKKIDEVESMFNKAFSERNHIDVLVNNAGLYVPVDNFSELSMSVLDDTLNVNLKAPFLLSKKFIELNKDCKKGRIINISSIGVKFGGSIGTMPYTVSKAALEMMTMTLSKEAAKYNILVNALRVGVTDTEIHKLSKSKNMENRVDMIPLKRMAMPEEIAEYILFLSSDKNSFTTGSIITIAGGE